jgi:hypothetical protein
MRSIWTFSCFLAFSNLAFGQYVYFNNNYQPNDANSPYPAFLYELHNNYYIYGINYNADLNHTLDFWCINSEGESLYFYEFTQDQNVEMNAYGHRSNAAVTIADSSIILLNALNINCTISGEYLPSFNLLRVYEDSVVWSQNEVLEINNPCDSSSEYKAQGLFLDQNDQIVVYSYVEKAPTEEGLSNRGMALTYFDQNGTFLEHHESIQTEANFDGWDILKTVKPLNDYFIATASTAGEAGKHALIKLDHNANIIDSLQFGNPDYSQNQYFNGDIEFTILENGNILILYSWGNYYYFFPNQNAQQTMYTAIVDPETFEVLYNAPIESPIDGIMLEGVISLFHSIRTYNGENAFIFKYYSLPTLNGHQCLWQINDEGQTSWFREYLSPLEHPYDILHQAISTSDGGILCHGSCLPADLQQEDLWLLKLDACGYEEPSDCPPVVGVSNSVEVPNFNAWPNPFRTQIKAQLPANSKRVDWIDATGRLVHSENVYYPYQEWNLSTLPIGVYHMQVVLEDGGVLSKKVVKD